MTLDTARVIDAARLRHGFLTAAEVAQLAADEATRLLPLLVRCGGCRFTAPAQDVAHLIACVNAGGDYVRDVSLLANSQHDDGAARWHGFLGAGSIPVRSTITAEAARELRPVSELLSPEAQALLGLLTAKGEAV